jgi:hypothetical protein
MKIFYLLPPPCRGFVALPPAFSGTSASHHSDRSLCFSLRIIICGIQILHWQRPRHSNIQHAYTACNIQLCVGGNSCPPCVASTAWIFELHIRFPVVSKIVCALSFEGSSIICHPSFLLTATALHYRRSTSHRFCTCSLPLQALHYSASSQDRGNNQCKASTLNPRLPNTLLMSTALDFHS